MFSRHLSNGHFFQASCEELWGAVVRDSGPIFPWRTDCFALNGRNKGTSKGFLLCFVFSKVPLTMVSLCPGIVEDSVGATFLFWVFIGGKFLGQRLSKVLNTLVVCSRSG